MPNLLTAEELAVPLKVSPLTVKRWSRDGKIPTVWLSRTTRRFDFDEVLASLKTAHGTRGKGGAA